MKKKETAFTKLLEPDQKKAGAGSEKAGAGSEKAGAGSEKSRGRSEKAGAGRTKQEPGTQSRGRIRKSRSRVRKLCPAPVNNNHIIAKNKISLHCHSDMHYFP